MLSVDKELIESELKKKAIVLQDKELSFFTNNCSILATQSSLLTGFSYQAVMRVGFTGVYADSWTLSFFYYMASGVAMGSMISTLLISMLCSMYGPGLALQGPQGSMKRAVDGMAWAQYVMTRIFTIGLFSFNTSGIAYAWIAYESWTTAWVVSTLLMVVAIVLAYLWRVVQAKFAFDSGRLVSGTFHGRELMKGLEDTSLLVKTRDDAVGHATRAQPVLVMSHLPNGTSQSGPGL